MTHTVLVTGVTGTLGRHLVTVLRERGRTVRGLSRRPSTDWHRGDLLTGSGLDAALDGVDAVIHAASNPRRSREDLPATRNLLAAATRAGSPHVVYISIVGVDVIPYPYYRVKHQVEHLVAAYGGTTLRTTQFHEFVLTGARLAAKLPLVLAPAVDVQPVATRDVAVRLVELSEAAPAGRVEDLGGPEVFATPELFRSYLRAVGSRRPVVPVRLPGKTFRRYADGAHLSPDHRSAGERWGDFLARTVSSPPS